MTSTFFKSSANAPTRIATRARGRRGAMNDARPSPTSPSSRPPKVRARLRPSSLRVHAFARPRDRRPVPDRRRRLSLGTAPHPARSPVAPSLLSPPRPRVLRTPSPHDKAAMTDEIHALWVKGAIAREYDPDVPSADPPSRPARDDRVVLVPPARAPRLGKGGSPESRVAIHSTPLRTSRAGPSTSPGTSSR